MQSFYRFSLLLILSLFLSCADDDVNPIVTDTAEPVLIEKITQTIYFGTTSESYIADFSYENNVLVRVDYEGTHQEFIYDGIKITAIKEYSNNVLVGTNSLSYNGNILVSMESDGNSASGIDFIHTSNGLSAIEYKYRDNGQWTTFMRDDYTFSPETNVSERVRTNYSLGSNSRNEYTYAPTHNPFRDMNPYFRLISSFEGVDPKNANNPVTQTAFSPANSTFSEEYLYETIYNTQQFPTVIRRKTLDGDVISITQIEYK